MEDRRFDSLIIGGGIVGAGVARDAALRGLRVLLVEQADFASGTSSRSSRLLHGGLRYLAQGHIGLVREASREKKVLHRIAPHLVQPLAFLFPAHRGSGWPRWKLWLGTKLYDLLCGGENFGNSRALSRQQMEDLLPGILTTGLTGGVRYFDALTSDARLVIDTLRSAARNGAVLRNYMKLESAEPVLEGWQCILVDQLSSDSISVTARSIVNATGPWSDRVPRSRTSLRLTKGVHLMVPNHRLLLPDAVVMPQNKRILFAIPCGDQMILGTTDTDYNGPLSDPKCDTADVTYVLKVVNRMFPSAKLKPRDVLSTWAGIRPLIARGHGAPSDTSRRHQVKQAEPGWWDVTGGKLTTYRLMAEEVVDQFVRTLDTKASPCRTAEEPLLPANETEFSRIAPLAPSREAVEHYCLNEWAVHLEDIMLRRTSWRHSTAPESDAAKQVADWMAPLLGWDGSIVDSQVERYRESLREHASLINDFCD